MAHFLTRFTSEINGATAIEYALIASGIGVAIAATVVLLGTDLNTFWANIHAGFL